MPPRWLSNFIVGVIVRNTFDFIPVVPLLALKMKKDLSEIAGWAGPTKKDMDLLGISLGMQSIFFDLVLRYTEHLLNLNEIK